MIFPSPARLNPKNKIKTQQDTRLRVTPSASPITVFDEFTPNPGGQVQFLELAGLLCYDYLNIQPGISDRTVYGFELSPEYCEVIIQRFEKFTGIEAKLIGTL